MIRVISLIKQVLGLIRLITHGLAQNDQSIRIGAQTGLGVLVLRGYLMFSNDS